jgi:PHD/YefM family antitoxin component YafN of YafNO toxin-antitoxin module
MNLYPFLGVLLVLSANGTRYGIAPDLRTYPQSTAKQTLASLLKAVESKRVDYVVAQLADPAFVDDRVKRLYGGQLAEQVEDTRARLDPLTLKHLQRYLRDGEWHEGNERVTVRMKDEPQWLYFKKDNGRWFMEHASKPSER